MDVTKVTDSPEYGKAVGRVSETPQLRSAIADSHAGVWGHATKTPLKRPTTGRLNGAAAQLWAARGHHFGASILRAGKKCTLLLLYLNNFQSLDVQRSRQKGDFSLRENPNVRVVATLGWLRPNCAGEEGTTSFLALGLKFTLGEATTMINAKRACSISFVFVTGLAICTLLIGAEALPSPNRL